jgi:hypothetical protein
MVEKKETLAKRDEKRRLDKEATCDSFFDFRMRAIEVEKRNAKAKAMEAESKQPKREIMLIDVTNMTSEERAWVEKKQAMSRQHEA